MLERSLLSALLRVLFMPSGTEGSYNTFHAFIQRARTQNTSGSGNTRISTVNTALVRHHSTAFHLYAYVHALMRAQRAKNLIMR